MNPFQAAAYVQAQAVCATAEIEAMKAANRQRQSNDYSDAYGEEAFLQVIEKYGIHRNAILSLFEQTHG